MNSNTDNTEQAFKRLLAKLEAPELNPSSNSLDNSREIVGIVEMDEFQLKKRASLFEEFGLTKECELELGNFTVKELKEFDKNRVQAMIIYAIVKYGSVSLCFRNYEKTNQVPYCTESTIPKAFRKHGITVKKTASKNQLLIKKSPVDKTVLDDLKLMTPEKMYELYKEAYNNKLSENKLAGKLGLSRFTLRNISEILLKIPNFPNYKRNENFRKIFPFFSNDLLATTFHAPNASENRDKSDSQNLFDSSCSSPEGFIMRDSAKRHSLPLKQKPLMKKLNLENAQNKTIQSLTRQSIELKQLPVIYSQGKPLLYSIEFFNPVNQTVDNKNNNKNTSIDEKNESIPKF